MARRSKWPNQELWGQAAQWRKGGLTYSDICGQLAKHENMKRFGLKEVPSEDTVRREVSRLLARPAPKDAGDVELGPHGRELFWFGQRLRDRVSLVMPHKMAESTTKSSEVVMWSGKPVSLSAKHPTDAEEQSVDNEWGFGYYDARTHSLFPSLQRHLVDHPCWAALEKVRGACEHYRDACLEAADMVLTSVRERLPELAEWDAKAMSLSLLIDAYYRVAGSPGLSFSYKPQRLMVGGKVCWQLKLGAWAVGLAGKDDPAALQPLVQVHQELHGTLPSTTELKALGEIVLAARQAIDEFQQTLRPDAHLRKLVLDGCCDWCP